MKRNVTQVEKKKHNQHVLVRLDIVTYSALKAAAEKQDRSLGYLSRKLIEDALQRLPRETADHEAVA